MANQMITNEDNLLCSKKGGEHMSERFPETDWYCDHCNAYLNSQSGFDDHKYTWKCTECGHKNSISRDNIYETEADFRKKRRWW